MPSSFAEADARFESALPGDHASLRRLSAATWRYRRRRRLAQRSRSPGRAAGVSTWGISLRASATGGLLDTPGNACAPLFDEIDDVSRLLSQFGGAFPEDPRRKP